MGYVVLGINNAIEKLSKKIMLLNMLNNIC
jgi:hypothetical protein